MSGTIVARGPQPRRCREISTAVALLCVALALGSCATKPGIKEAKLAGAGRATGMPAVNLFGLEEAQLHWMHYNIQTRQRVLVVHFDADQPSEMQLLDCSASGQWEYQLASGKHVQEVRVRNQAELRARVPLGVARFSAYLKGDNQLRFKYVAVGGYHLKEDPKLPRDHAGCANATHYVASLSVGAYRLEESSEKALGGEAGVPGVAKGGGSASSAEGAKTRFGDVERCVEEPGRACRTPMQVMLIPLSDRYWVAGRGESQADPVEPRAVVTEEPPPGGGSKATPDPPRTVSIDEGAWRPGHYMAKSLSKLLPLATYIMEQTSYGLDFDGTAILGGYVHGGNRLHTTRQLKADREYIFFASSNDTSDIDIRILDEDDNVLAQDIYNDPQPIVHFSPPKTGNYKIMLSGGDESVTTFGTLAIANSKGFTDVSPEMMHAVFQGTLDKGVQVNRQFREEGFAGAMFHDRSDDWSLYGMLLAQGEQISQGGLEPPLRHGTIFLATAHRDDMDLNIRVVDDQGQQRADMQPDSFPVVYIPPSDAERSYRMSVSLRKGPVPTLAVSLILLTQPSGAVTGVEPGTGLPAPSVAVR